MSRCRQSNIMNRRERAGIGDGEILFRPTFNGSGMRRLLRGDSPESGRFASKPMFG
jgi:hypothetical protein